MINVAMATNSVSSIKDVPSAKVSIPLSKCFDLLFFWISDV